MLEDAERATETVRRSDLDWIVVRVPFVKEGARTGTYRTGYLPERGRPTIARGDIADFMLKQLTDNTYLRQAPMLMY